MKRDDAAGDGNTEIGDGPKYKGKGCMQLTWKNNYIRYQTYLDGQLSNEDEYNVIDSPDILVGYLPLAIDSAGWFWNYGNVLSNGNTLDLNLLADALRTDRISTLINGGADGKAERQALTENLFTLFNYEKCVRYQP